MIRVSSSDLTNLKRQNTVYDPRMGVIDDTQCVVCKEKVATCNGHFGHIKFVVPLY